MDSVMIQAAACGGVPVGFDNLPLAIEFLRMVTHQIVPDQWVAAVKALVPSPDTADAMQAAKELVTKCLGTPT